MQMAIINVAFQSKQHITLHYTTLHYHESMPDISCIIIVNLKNGLVERPQDALLLSTQIILIELAESSIRIASNTIVLLSFGL